jgi:hypothetical protein
MPDGKRFLVTLLEARSKEQPHQGQQVNLVVNWFEELKQRVPVK